nr:MAG TPA: hypothetical protein [Caudoviricetes sp.]
MCCSSYHCCGNKRCDVVFYVSKFFKSRVILASYEIVSLARLFIKFINKQKRGEHYEF